MFRKILRENRWLVTGFITIGIAVSALSALGTHYFQRLLDDFAVGTLTLPAIVLYAAVMVAGYLFGYGDNYPYAKLENRIYLSFKLFALQKMSTIRYPDYQKLGTGELVQRIENGASAGKDILFDYYFRLIRELLPDVLLSLFFIASISRTIVLAVLAGYLMVFLVTRLLLKYLYRVKEKILVNEEFLNGRLVRGFMELAVFRTNRRFGVELQAGKCAADEITSAKTKMLLIHEAFFTLFALLVTAIKVVVIVYGFLTRALTVGEIVALVAFLDKAYTPIAIFNVLYVKYRLDRVAYQRFAEMMELPDDRRLSASREGLSPLDGRESPVPYGEVSFSRINCSYEGKAVLKGVSLHIPAGTSAALVGESGSGKSTLVKLLVGLLEPDTGTVSVDGRPLSETDLNRYYESVSYISQEAPVFNGTLRENLVFDGELPDGKLLEALEQVELGEFVRRLPEGLAAQMGEKGVKMSGGERQRLALARLWLSDPRLIILDEATSAMDSITEETVMARVMDRLRGRTVVVVAHRLKTIARCGQICAMKDGAIVEQGSFSELMEKEGYFVELWKAGLSAEGQ